MQAISTPTGIYLSVAISGAVSTGVKRIGRGRTDLSKVCELNDLSQSVASESSPGEILATARQIIAKPPEYSNWQ